MAIAPGNFLTASSPNSKTPTIAVPAGAVNGDWIVAALTYAGPEAITPPTGWTPVDGAPFATSTTTGGCSIIVRQMAAGVTQVQWTLATATDGIYGKSAMVIGVLKGAASWVKGALLNRSGTATTISDLPGVAVPTGGLLLALAGDKVSNQTSATVQASMTEDAKVITGGGGSVSALMAHEFPAAGASGTRRVTYGLSASSGWGLMMAFAPTVGTVPPTVSISAANASATIAAGVARTLSADVTGATSGSWAMISAPPLAAATPPAITSPTSATAASVTPTVAGTYVFRYTATNSAGSDSGDITLTVTDTTARPVGVVTNPGNFIAVGADTADLALADASDATYIEVDGTSGQSIEVQLSVLDLRTTEVIHVRCYYTAAPTGTLVVKLKQGATVIATRTQAIGTGVTTYPFTLTAGELAAITNNKDLRLQMSVQ